MDRIVEDIRFGNEEAVANYAHTSEGAALSAIVGWRGPVLSVYKHLLEEEPPTRIVISVELTAVIEGKVQELKLIIKAKDLPIEQEEEDLEDEMCS